MRLRPKSLIGLATLLLWAGTCSSQAASASMYLGTGFFYNQDGDLFTNRHVVEDCELDSIRARTSDQQWHLARLIAMDSHADLAALTIDHAVEAFASFRLASGRTVSVPSEVEDAFSSGFSDPRKNDLKLQTKWGQIQAWRDPNEAPYVNRMRMDAYPGSSGSAILDYAGLLIGVVFAGSVAPVTNYEEMKRIGYGDKWIYIYNNNALVRFANEYKLKYSAWDKWERKDPAFIWTHSKNITVLLACKEKVRLGPPGAK